MAQPEKIGRYTIESEIGRGGMAVVYRAHDPHFERFVALKVLPAEFLHEPNFRARFEREAKTIAALEHPAVVPVYDFGEDGDFLFLVMRFMQGGSLADRLTKGPLPVVDVSQIMRRIGSALDAAHAQGIIHRDLKPGNILFDHYGEAYLSDFGIARLTEAAATLTGSKASLGTPGYMSPEQIKGEKVDARSDIYALGVIVFEMLTGKRPFSAESPAMVLVKQMTETPPHIRDIQPDLPAQYDVVLAQTMAREPDERPSTAGDVIRLLSDASVVVQPVAATNLTAAVPETADLQPEAEIAPTMVDTPPEEPVGGQDAAGGKRPLGSKWWLWLVAIVVGLLIIGIGYNALRPTEEPVAATEPQIEEQPDVDEAESEPAEEIVTEINDTSPEIDPDASIDVDATIDMLFAMLAEGNHDQVLAETEAILAENPDLAPIHAIRAIALRDVDELEAAHDHISIATELAPEEADFWFEHAIIHNWRGESEDAIDSANHCLDIDPHYVSCLTERAYAFLSLQDDEAAEQDFLQVLEIAPDDWSAHTELAWIYLWAEQDYDRALEHINRVIELDSLAYFNYYQRGLILREAGDSAGAANNLRLYVDMSHPDECSDCYAEAQSFLDEFAPDIVNLALDKPASASQEIPDNPAVLAVDGDFDSCWFAGENAPQELDINLEQASNVFAIQLMIAQEEPGFTINRILSQDLDGEFYELAFIEEATWDRKVIIVTPEQAWEGINNLRIETLESVSWPAWCEIRVFGQVN